MSRTPRLLVVGASTSQVCGVRDYVLVTAAALSKRGATVDIVWWDRNSEWNVRQTFAEARSWLVRVEETAKRTEPDWIVWHYSPFTYGWRGIALLQPLVARALAGSGIPVLGVLHELAHDLDRRGWRGPALGVTQRIALATVVRACAACVVTTEPRLQWLERRRWLPKRPAAALPVCSNVPETIASAEIRREGLRIGVFGFGLEGTRAEVALRAIAALRAAGCAAEVILIGRGDHPALERWRALAVELGVREALVATGVLEPAELGAVLAGCDVALFLDERGPMSRRTTLAAILQAGLPVLALDGRDRWHALTDEAAARVVPAERFSAALVELARDPTLRRELGEHGRRFYGERMSPETIAAGTLALLEQAGSASAQPRRERRALRHRRPLHLSMLVNRPGVQLRRAHELARRFPASVEARVSAASDPRELTRAVRRSDAVYVIDPGRFGFPSAAAARMVGKAVVVELGDPGAALYAAQDRGRASVAAGSAIDWLVGNASSAVVVRGRRIAQFVNIRVPCLELPDGVDLERFRPGLEGGLRRELGVPDDVLLAGLVGSLKRSRTCGAGYGWDLVEALALLPDAPVWGLVVGDGSGLTALVRRAAELGVADRLVTPGRVEPELVPPYVCALDVCLSTQTNDAVGQSRTTAKLPEYLACDRFVLATAVGGALDVLPEEMLLPYEGSYDPAHPGRLAARLAALVEHKNELRRGAGTRTIAIARYDYDKLAERLAAFLIEISAR